MVKTKIVKTSPKHEAFYQAVAKAMKDNDIDHIEAVAVTANILGKLIAYQDQRLYTPEQMMQIVSDNIEAGNRHALEQIMSAEGKPQ
jgi:hypothetical protein